MLLSKESPSELSGLNKGVLKRTVSFRVSGGGLKKKEGDPKDGEFIGSSRSFKRSPGGETNKVEGLEVDMLLPLLKSGD